MFPARVKKFFQSNFVNKLLSFIGLLMKNLIKISLLSFFIAALFFCLQAKPRTDSSVNNIGNQSLENLIHGLKSDNAGVKKCCIYFCGKYKVEQSVKQLARILNSEKENEDVRILAALSLYEIASDDCAYYLRQITKFAENKKVKTKCYLLYTNLGLKK
jgi:hypothetical protein